MCTTKKTIEKLEISKATFFYWKKTRPKLTNFILNIEKNKLLLLNNDELNHLSMFLKLTFKEKEKFLELVENENKKI